MTVYRMVDSHHYDGIDSQQYDGSLPLAGIVQIDLSPFLAQRCERENVIRHHPIEKIIILGKLFIKGSFQHKYISIFSFSGHEGILAYFFQGFFKKFQFFQIFIQYIKICSEYKYNSNFYFGGMFGGILAHFFQFVSKNLIFFKFYYIVTLLLCMHLQFFTHPILHFLLDNQAQFTL